MINVLLCYYSTLYKALQNKIIYSYQISKPPKKKYTHLDCDDYGGKTLPPIDTREFNTDQQVVTELCHSAAKVSTKSLDEDQK